MAQTFDYYLSNIKVGCWDITQNRIKLLPKTIRRLIFYLRLSSRLIKSALNHVSKEANKDRYDKEGNVSHVGDIQPLLEGNPDTKAGNTKEHKSAHRDQDLDDLARTLYNETRLDHNTDCQNSECNIDMGIEDI